MIVNSRKILIDNTTTQAYSFGAQTLHSSFFNKISAFTRDACLFFHFFHKQAVTPSETWLCVWQPDLLDSKYASKIAYTNVLRNFNVALNSVFSAFLRIDSCKSFTD